MSEVKRWWVPRVGYPQVVRRDDNNGLFREMVDASDYDTLLARAEAAEGDNALLREINNKQADHLLFNHEHDPDTCLACGKMLESVLRIRCLDHKEVPAYNAKESGGGECPSCEIEPLRADNAKLREEITRLEQLVCDYQASAMLGVDPAGVTPSTIERHVTELREEIARRDEAARGEFGEALHLYSLACYTHGGTPTLSDMPGLRGRRATVESIHAAVVADRDRLAKRVYSLRSWLVGIRDDNRNGMGEIAYDEFSYKRREGELQTAARRAIEADDAALADAGEKP